MVEFFPALGWHSTLTRHHVSPLTNIQKVLITGWKSSTTWKFHLNELNHFPFTIKTSILNNFKLFRVNTKIILFVMNIDRWNTKVFPNRNITWINGARATCSPFLKNKNYSKNLKKYVNVDNGILCQHVNHQTPNTLYLGLHKKMTKSDIWSSE
jgi:hypothetical protein